LLQLLWNGFLSRKSAAGAEADCRTAGLRHVTLLQRGADDFTGFEPASFDTVILNSVVQYFPSVDYLVQVLEGAVQATRPGGAIFIGDVRDLRLLEAFHLSVELERAPASMRVSKLRQQMEKRVAEEPELAVDPALFLALRQHFPSIGFSGFAGQAWHS